MNKGIVVNFQMSYQWTEGEDYRGQSVQQSDMRLWQDWAPHQLNLIRGLSTANV